MALYYNTCVRKLIIYILIFLCFYLIYYFCVLTPSHNIPLITKLDICVFIPLYISQIRIILLASQLSSTQINYETLRISTKELRHKIFIPVTFSWFMARSFVSQIRIMALILLLRSLRTVKINKIIFLISISNFLLLHFFKPDIFTLIAVLFVLTTVAAAAVATAAFAATAAYVVVVAFTLYSGRSI